MQRFETLHPVNPLSRSRRPERQPISESRPSSRRASSSPQRPPHCQRAMDGGALINVSLPSTARPLALDPRATAHQLAPFARIGSPVPLGAAQQSDQLAPFPLAPYAFTSFEPSVLPALSSNPAESPQSKLLLAPLAPTPKSVASLPLHQQHVLQYSQSALRVARTLRFATLHNRGAVQVLPIKQHCGRESACTGRK